MYKRKQKSQSEVGINNAKNEIEQNGPKWSIRQWIQDFIDIVDGFPPTLDGRRSPEWLVDSKLHPIAVLLELSEVEIKALKSVLVVRTTEVNDLMENALMNRCRGCDFLQDKIEKELERNNMHTEDKDALGRDQTMTHWYCYYNEKGKKTIVTGKHLFDLAQNGQISPDTVIENMEGKKAQAKRVKGLTFDTMPHTHASISVGNMSSYMITLIGIVAVSLVGWIGWKIIEASAQQTEQAANVVFPVEQVAEEQERQERDAVALAEQERRAQDVAIRAQFTPAEQAEVDKFLEQYGRELKLIDEDGNTLLHKAMDVVSPNERNVSERTVWDIAVAQYLVASGLNVNAQNNRGDTPLHVAVDAQGRIVAPSPQETRYPAVEKIVWLIRNGADVNVKNNPGGHYSGTLPHQGNLRYLRRTGSQSLYSHAQDPMIPIFNEALSPLPVDEIVRREFARVEQRRRESEETHRRILAAQIDARRNDRIGGQASAALYGRGEPDFERTIETSSGTTQTLRYGDRTYHIRNDRIEGISTIRAD